MEMETYVIETPLFPIILAKAWEPRSAASTSTSSSNVVASTAN
jgi:hypothetical protein